jgi:hypothetical protein
VLPVKSAEFGNGRTPFLFPVAIHFLLLPPFLHPTEQYAPFSLYAPILRTDFPAELFHFLIDSIFYQEDQLDT